MSEIINDDKILPEIIKISQVIDLCFDLLSETKKNLIMKGTSNQKISDIYIESYHNYLPFSEYDITDDVFFETLERKVCIRCFFKHIENHEKISYIKKSIAELKKKTQYTDALVNVISHLLYLDDIYREMSYRNHSFIGELFVDMGRINSALKLYEIDKSFFHDPNTLSLLANNAIKINKLEWAIKLIEQLTKQEPYHPSISILQADIKRLEQRNHLKSTLSIDFSKIDELSGVEFENLLQDKFAAMGFKVESTPTTGDFGADLILENSEGSRIIVQCKRFKSKVNLKAVQEVVGAMGHYAGDYGVVITNSSFLNSAIKLAESHDIELWDGDKLVSFLSGDLSFSKISV
jgi:HJR/Mrr/RecB family endonuclease